MRLTELELRLAHAALLSHGKDPAHEPERRRQIGRLASKLADELERRAEVVPPLHIRLRHCAGPGTAMAAQ